MTLLIKDSKLTESLYKQRDKEYQYHKCADVEFDPNCGITEEEIEEFIKFIDSGKSYSIFDIRNQALRLAIKYRFNINSFWKYIMYRTGKWVK